MSKSSKDQIDQDEKKILSELVKDAKENIDTIAKHCGFSREKTWRMIKMKNNEKYKGKRLMNYLPLLFLYPFTTLNIDYGWMMGGDHMMDWWGIPFMGFWMIGIWLIFIVIAFLVFQDANKRGINGLLWLILVILPVIGIVFLVVYSVIRRIKRFSNPQPR